MSSKKEKYQLLLEKHVLVLILFKNLASSTTNTDVSVPCHCSNTVDSPCNVGQCFCLPADHHAGSGGLQEANYTALPSLLQTGLGIHRITKLWLQGTSRDL